MKYKTKIFSNIKVLNKKKSHLIKKNSWQILRLKIFNRGFFCFVLHQGTKLSLLDRTSVTILIFISVNIYTVWTIILGQLQILYLQELSAMEAQTMKLPAHSFCVLVWSCAVIESAVLATLMHYEHSATPLCNFTSSAMLWFLNASAYIYHL